MAEEGVDPRRETPIGDGGGEHRLELAPEALAEALAEHVAGNDLAGQRLLEPRELGLGGGVDLRLGPRVEDDVFGREGLAEQRLGEARDGSTRVLLARGVDGRARGQAPQVIDTAVFLEAADEARHVRALAARIGVHLVKHECSQAADLLEGEHVAVLPAGEDQLEHHVVRDQQVRPRLAERVAVDDLGVARRVAAG